jgi:phosphate-selective porin OprO and OprP
VALNWYLNQNLRWILEYDQTRFTGGAGTGTAIANRATENAVLTRFSLVF